MPQLVMNLSVV